MKLLGKDISAEAWVHGFLTALAPVPHASADNGPIRFDAAEARVDPIAFNLEAMSEHADPTRPFPFETDRRGLARAVSVAQWLFRTTGQIVMNEAFSRQKQFNGHVRDAYAQLSADMVRLQEQLAKLENRMPEMATSPSPGVRRTPRKKLKTE